MPDDSENGGKKPDIVTKTGIIHKKLQNSKIDDHTDQSNNDDHTGPSKQRRSHRSVQNHGGHTDQPSTQKPQKPPENAVKTPKTLSKPLGDHTDQPTQQKHSAVTQTSRHKNTRRSHRPAVSTHANTSHDAAHHAVSKTCIKLAKNATKLT